MDFFRMFFLGITSIFKGIIAFFRYFFIGLVNTISFIPRYFVIGILVIFGKRKREKSSKENKKLSFAILCLSLSVYLVCVFIISRWYVQGLKIKYLSNDIINSTEILEEQEVEEDDNIQDNQNENEPVNENNDSNNSSDKPVYYPNDYWDYLSVPFMDVNFDELLKKNNDTVGWIKIDGTKVNYPVVQSEDNDFYLSHDFRKNNNIGGWIFADYRVNFETFGKNTIIYGHNMNNKTMFGSVPSMLYNGYLNNSSNNYIRISTPTCNTIWKVFSIYTIEPEVYYLKTNFRTEPFDKFLTTIKNRSIYNFGIDVTDNDKILTLSTCDNSGTKRVVVHAKMINIEYK